MLTEKIEAILLEDCSIQEKVKKLEALYYKYENEQVKLGIEEQKTQLKEWLKPYLPIYGKDMLNEFYVYWTEHNVKGKKVRYKMQKVFDLPKRLATWARHQSERQQREKLVRKYEFLAR
jgi:hypothetical protein